MNYETAFKSQSDDMLRTFLSSHPTEEDEPSKADIENHAAAQRAREHATRLVSRRPIKFDAIKLLLLEKPQIQQPIREAQTQLVRYEVIRKEYEDIIYPEEAAIRIKSELGLAKDAAEINGIRQRLAFLEAPGAHDAGIAARKIVRRTWDGGPKVALQKLVKQALETVLQWKGE